MSINSLIVSPLRNNIKRPGSRISAFYFATTILDMVLYIDMCPVLRKVPTTYQSMTLPIFKATTNFTVVPLKTHNQVLGINTLFSLCLQNFRHCLHPGQRSLWPILIRSHVLIVRIQHVGTDVLIMELD
jgi:hypothetical protein